MTDRETRVSFSSGEIRGTVLVDLVASPLSGRVFTFTIIVSSCVIVTKTRNGGRSSVFCVRYVRNPSCFYGRLGLFESYFGYIRSKFTFQQSQLPANINKLLSIF